MSSFLAVPVSENAATVGLVYSRCEALRAIALGNFVLSVIRRRDELFSLVARSF